MKISYMNEIANLCEVTGADVDKVRITLGADSRIGKRFLFPGVGYGGSCFPKDVAALINTSNEVKYEFRILKAVNDINKKQIDIFINKIKKHYKGKISGKRFAVWGLAFKPNTDDVREAPSIAIINRLLAEGCSISAYDPVAKESTKGILGNKINYAKLPYDALKNADALLIITEWNEFRNPDFERISSMLKQSVIFDGRNLYDVDKMKEMKFVYYSVGRKAVKR
jgi:UDPglucose 6-dehydrogenase